MYDFSPAITCWVFQWAHHKAYPFFIGGQGESRQQSRVATDPDRLKRYLTCEAPDKKWVSDKLVYLLSGEVIIPPFSEAAIKLGQLSRNENCQMEDVA